MLVKYDDCFVYVALAENEITSMLAAKNQKGKLIEVVKTDRIASSQELYILQEDLSNYSLIPHEAFKGIDFYTYQYFYNFPRFDLNLRFNNFVVTRATDSSDSFIVTNGKKSYLGTLRETLYESSERYYLKNTYFPTGFYRKGDAKHLLPVCVSPSDALDIFENFCKVKGNPQEELQSLLRDMNGAMA